MKNVGFRRRSLAILSVITALAVSGCSKDSSEETSAKPSSSASVESSQSAIDNGSSRSGDTHGDSSSDTPSSDGNASRTDLKNEQIVEWTRSEQISPNQLKLYFSSGTEKCYGARAVVKESDTSVEVATIVGRLPNASANCSLIGREASVIVKTEKPIGERKVDHLKNVDLH